LEPLEKFLPPADRTNKLLSLQSFNAVTYQLSANAPTQGIFVLMLRNIAEP